MAKAWTQEELAWARECAAAGDTWDEIGAELGCAPGVVKSRLSLKKRLPDIHRAVAERFAAGVPCSEIAAEVLPGRGGRSLVYSYVTTMRGWGYDIPRRLTARARPSLDDCTQLNSDRYREAQDRNRAIEGVLGTGPSYSELARRFGTSRSAVSGVAKRLRDRQSARAAHV